MLLLFTAEYKYSICLAWCDVVCVCVFFDFTYSSLFICVILLYGLAFISLSSHRIVSFTFFIHMCLCVSLWLLYKMLWHQVLFVYVQYESKIDLKHWICSPQRKREENICSNQYITTHWNYHFSMEQWRIFIAIPLYFYR